MPSQRASKGRSAARSGAIRTAVARFGICAWAWFAAVSAVPAQPAESEEPRAPRTATAEADAGAEDAGADDAGTGDAGAGEVGAGPGRSAEGALARGNRLFEEGELEAAVEAYAAGYSPDAPHPTLIYNLGTALHHLDRLPEAILWYSRGDLADPWLDENLWLARRSLGSQRLPVRGLDYWLAHHRGQLGWAAIVVAWLVLLWVVLPIRTGSKPVLAGALLALALYGAGLASDQRAPEAAVLLADCPAPSGPIPAGTEIWVRPTAEGFRVLGTAEEVRCETPIVGLVEASSGPG